MGESGSTATGRLVDLINAIPTAREGEIISADYHNTLRDAVLEIATQLGHVLETRVEIKTGIVRDKDFSSELEIFDQIFQVTDFLEHGLGETRVAMMVGIAADRERIRVARKGAEIYEASNLTETIQIFAISNPSDGTFALIANQETLKRFDSFRWWAIKA